MNIRDKVFITVNRSLQNKHIVRHFKTVNLDSKLYTYIDKKLYYGGPMWTISRVISHTLSDSKGLFK